MSSRVLVAVVGIAFAVALAVVVGNRMSAEAMAVVVGVVCGVVAAIPMTVLMLVVTQRMRAREESEEDRLRQRDYPPVIVIQGGTPAPREIFPSSYMPPMVEHGAPRDFRVIGED